MPRPAAAALQPYNTLLSYPRSHLPPILRRDTRTALAEAAAVWHGPSHAFSAPALELSATASPPPWPPASYAPMPPSPPPGSVPPSVPKIIFMFWDSAQPPEFIAACIARTAQLNPGWAINVMTRDDPLSLEGLAEPPPLGGQYLDIAHLADWYRVDALARHGGVWLDASNIPVKPVTHWVDVHSPALQGFGALWDNSTMENWAFAAPYPCPLMREWRDQFHRAIEVGFSNYAAEIPLSTAGAVEAQLPYLTEHLAFRAARAALPSQPVRLMSSITHGGPFELYNNLFNDSAQAYGGAILNLPQSYFNDTGFVKIRGSDRAAIGALSSYHGYLAHTLRAALPAGYEPGSTYIAVNPMSVSWWIGICLAVAGVFTVVGIGLAMGALYCNRWVRRKGGYGALTQKLLGKGDQGVPAEVKLPAVEEEEQAGGCCAPPPPSKEM